MTTRNVPVLAIRNTVIFPAAVLPLRIGRPRSVAAITHVESEKTQWVLAVAQRVPLDEPMPSDLYEVGTLCKIEKIKGSADDGYQVILRGIARFHVARWSERGSIILADGDVLQDAVDADADTLAALKDSLKITAKEILALLPGETAQLQQLVDAVDDLSLLTHMIGATLDVSTEEKQKLLENGSLKGRALYLLDLMQSRKDSLKVKSEIEDKLSHKLGKLQRETILREQMKAIQEELDHNDESSLGKDDYEVKIEKAGMPESVKRIAHDEWKRFKAIGNTSPEAHVIRSYLDLLVALPWNNASESAIELDRARDVLEADHYGLDAVKKRILQHLAVMKLKANRKGSILLLVGPPGVGKTSLGQSIARALGRKFVRVSLGGVRDDAEIRGHRKTYVGAMPGRIVQGVRRAGERNPVFVLDEVDKLSRGFSGDPASALLEVLDPEQNSTFTDHYLDVPFDLSDVFFIATANSMDSIPGPLRDRMEVIEVSGYTSAEKLHIAKKHLVPKQLSDHGMSAEKLEISDEALLKVIAHYTREAGVRELQRSIASVVRGSSERVVRGEHVAISSREIEELLGPERFILEVAERTAVPGVATGLAWTPVGGEILFVEAGLMPGQGRLTLTGQLGDVMKESAQIALSLLRSRLAQISVGLEYEKKDLHIHVPAGAIPKDGPSAGVAILTTIASLCSGIGVDPELAMTGEITLRGAVMPVGGIKEKMIAAQRAGIKRVILPAKNRKDLRDVPEEVKSQLKFEWADTVGDVLQIALGIKLEDWRSPLEGCGRICTAPRKVS